MFHLFLSCISARGIHFVISLPLSVVHGTYLQSIDWESSSPCRSDGVATSLTERQRRINMGYYTLIVLPLSVTTQCTVSLPGWRVQWSSSYKSQSKCTMAGDLRYMTLKFTQLNYHSAKGCLKQAAHDNNCECSTSPCPPRKPVHRAKMLTSHISLLQCQ